MPRVLVVFVEPRSEGNVGALARSMGNFGYTELVLVNPCPLGEEAYKRAKHAGGILESARRVDTLQEALRDSDLVVGTTGISSARDKSFLRQSITPREFASAVAPTEDRIALLIGREDYGLYNEELEKVDMLVSIPCDPKYPVMNVSHAASIVLYELWIASSSFSQFRPRKASDFERERLIQAFEELLSAINYPSHKRPRTKVMFQRLMGRSAPSKWDFYALMGVLRGAVKTIQRVARSREDGGT